MMEKPTSAPASSLLWARHADDLLRFATVLVGPHDAHDVVADTFMQCRAVLDGDHVDNPRAYLMRSVANRARDAHRSTRRRWARDLAAILPASATAVEVDLDVHRAVASLSVAQRAVVYLAYWEDRTERDIAEMLQIPVGSVHRHLVRARIQLRKVLR
jgi:RNA polymerase sigma-70 factor (ECF subfamily)